MTDESNIEAEALTWSVPQPAEETPADRALDRATKANAEHGDVLVTIWCANCDDDDDRLGVVRRSSAGPVLDARGSALDMGADAEMARIDASRDLGHRLPTLPHGRVVAILTDPDNAAAREDWPPRVGCPMHGVDFLDPNELIVAARSARLGTPAKVIIHPHWEHGV